MKSSEISVVVQGAIDKKETKRCLKSIRKYLPKAEIILSTWKDSDVSDLDYDILVENDDPGTVKDKEYRYVNNINRQLVSTQSGLKRVNRKYTLKLRTDLYLKGDRFLEYFDKFPKTNEKYQCFKHKVIIPSVYSREFSKYRYKVRLTPFHPSDFFFFGLTEDIKSYFENTPLMPEEDMANYKYLYENRKPFMPFTFRYPPEQYFCLCFAKRYLDNIKFEDWTDWNVDLWVLSKHFIYSNFIILGALESQIYGNKHSISMLFDEKMNPGLISYRRFVNNYRRMFDMNYNKGFNKKFGYFYDKLLAIVKMKLMQSKWIIKNIFRTIYYNFC